MNATGTNVGGWKDSALRADMNSGEIWNLLPEELMRQVLAKEVEVESTDAFGMLERMGMESAGALVLQAEGAPLAKRELGEGGFTCL